MLDIPKFLVYNPNIQMKVEDLRCPGCGHPVSTDTKECEYCGRVIEITTFSNVSSFTVEDLKKHISLYNELNANGQENSAVAFSTGICFLKLKMFDKALMYFEKAIENDMMDDKSYFYASVCLLKGNKPFLATRKDIDKITVYIENAISFNPKAVYYYFMAYVRKDYFYRKGFNVVPSYSEYLKSAITSGISDNDINELFLLLGLEKKEEIYLNG